MNRQVIPMLAGALTACQLVAGFEDFSADGAGTSGGGSDSGGASGNAEAAAGSGGGQTDCTGGTWPGSANLEMIHTQRGDGACVWVDRIEVTREAYDVFLADPPSLPLPVPCDWKTTFAPACEGVDGGAGAAGQDGALPVVCVDWCDAQAYCASQGRSLCHGSYVNAAVVEDSDWYAVCSNLGASAYPYGATYDDEVCNGLEHSGDGVLPAEGQAACVTDSGVLNMSGNVWEWVDECDDASGADDACNVRGGSFNYDAQALACRSKIAPDRAARSSEYGFRCCAYE